MEKQKKDKLEKQMRIDIRALQEKYIEDETHELLVKTLYDEMDL